MTAGHVDIIDRSSEKAAAAVVRRHVSPGEIEDVMRVLPASIRALLQ